MLRVSLFPCLCYAIESCETLTYLVYWLWVWSLCPPGLPVQQIQTESPVIKKKRLSHVKKEATVWKWLWVLYHKRVSGLFVNYLREYICKIPGIGWRMLFLDSRNQAPLNVANGTFAALVDKVIMSITSKPCAASALDSFFMLCFYT